MRILVPLCLLSIALAPALTRGNSPAPPPALRYLSLADKKDAGKQAPVKQIALVENAPITLTYLLDLPRPKLVIPQKFATVDGKGLKAEIEPGGTRNLFAGIALSAAFVSGGIWLVRRGKAGKALLIVAILCGLLSVAVLLPHVIGNEAAPPRPKALTPIDIKGNSAELGMDLVIVAEGERIQLYLPKRLLPAIMIPRQAYEGNFVPIEVLPIDNTTPKDGAKKE